MPLNDFVQMTDGLGHASMLLSLAELAALAARHSLQIKFADVSHIPEPPRWPCARPALVD